MHVTDWFRGEDIEHVATRIRKVFEDGYADAEATFTCTVPLGAASFAIPAYALAHFPATRAGLLASRGAITVRSTALKPVSLLGTSLDAGFAIFSYVESKTVQFK